MLTLRPSAERGRADHGWLESRHSFSFGGYRDPKHMGFGDLLVINEDRVAPGAGFPTHAHDNMEILSYVIEGALEHRDSIGTGSVIRPGEIQRMSAGTGIRHSEYNASPSEAVHFLQIWIRPSADGIAPGYAQATLPVTDGAARLDVIAGPDVGEGTVALHQDAVLYRGMLAEGQTLALPLAATRRGWVQMIHGAADAGGVALAAGDGLAITGEAGPKMTASAATEFLFFDLA